MTLRASYLWLLPIPRPDSLTIDPPRATNGTTMTERDFAVDVVRRLRNAGHEALWAGGCVRDELLALVPKDYDVATDARPEEVRRLFKRTVAEIGRAHV